MFKKNATGRSKGSDAWKRDFNWFKTDPERYYHLYHRRQPVEAFFSMLKRKMLDYLRAKSDIGQENEILCRLVANNICVLNGLYQQMEEKDEKKYLPMVGSD